MFPWMRGHLVDAWYNRKSSTRTAKMSNPESSSTMLMPVATPSESFSINVISLQGNVADITVTPDLTIEKIKAIVMKHFYDHDTTKMLSQFRLVHPSKFRQLVDGNSVNDEGIREHDKLILTEIRTAPAKENLSEEVLKGPTKEAILRATSKLPIRNPPRPVSSVGCPADFQNEMQKILTTLVKASAKILTYSPEAQKFYDILEQKLKEKCKPNIDPNTVKILMEMGYSHESVLKVLRLRKSNITEALEWLIDNQDNLDDNEEDDDLSPVAIENNNDNDTAGPSLPGNQRKKSLKEACIELFKGDSQSSKKEGNLISIVDLLVESIQSYKKMDFKPNSTAVQTLLEMGFEEKSIVSALKVTGNNQANACEWLLGDRRPSLQDLGTGLDSNSPIYKAIMNNAHIQLSLTNPKMLLVYLSMLETPNSTNVWINDPDVFPVVNQIINTYHLEKDAIQMNRYTNN
ncbi:kip1 ubiquitination-promoting complex subunit 2 isoform X1 [Andrena cerasifolii]|uniref:kip1 ubiquitination-promoting complex subunit 2 isoform X1 n=1 Tax=Andrena cerasifolii TaxID=2819439 RepID=UPI004037E836